MYLAGDSGFVEWWSMNHRLTQGKSWRGMLRKSWWCRLDWMPGCSDRAMRQCCRRRKKAFGANSSAFTQLQQLRVNAAARSARAAGIKPVPLSRQNLALARRTVATLKRLQPHIPRRFPPDVPSPVVAGPPYNASVPVDFSSSGEVDFRPWDAGPKAATGQVGGALNTWSGGVGMAKSQVGVFIQVPAPPTPRLAHV